jgi:hypothetical protein
MKVRITLPWLAAAVFAAAATAPAMAQPGPEQKKLDYLVGKWKTEIDVKPSAASPGGKVSGTEECESFANLHVVCKSESTSAAGLYKSMRVISYVAALKQYSQYTVDSLGYAVLSLGAIQGNTWTFTSDLGTMKTRYTMKTSGDSYTMTSEYAGADGKFAPTSTGKATKSK